MSRLDELIAELCPNGVDIKNVGDICDTITDYTAAGSFADVAKNVKYINDGVGYAQLIRTTDLKSTFKNTDKFVYVDEHAFNYLWRVNLNSECLVLPNVGNCGEVYYVTPDILPFSHNVLGPNSILVKSSIVDNRYLFHAFQSGDFQKKLAKITSTTGQTKFNKTNFKALSLPVPPLEVQREIVHILDSFTLLTAELTAELTARQKQYSYYRDELLKPQKNIPVVTLKEIATSIYRGVGIKRDQVTEDGIPCVRYGEIYTTYNTWFDECVSHTKEEYVSSPKYFEHGDILFAITGESVEDIAKSIAYVGHDKCLAGGDIVVLKHQQNPRYLAHVLNTTMAREQKSKGKVKSKVVHSNVPSIEQIKIPLPSLEVQERYADVLDNFEAICTDLNIGLPAEIEARQKQYEYYRDLLLTFAETGSMLMTDRQTDRQTELSAIKLIQYVFGYAMLPLGKVANVFRGEYITKKNTKEGTIPVILGGQEPAYYIDKYNHDGEIVVVARSGASAGFVSYWNQKIFVTDGFGYEEKSELIATKFLYYVLKNMESELNAMKRGAGVPHVSGEMLNSIELPIPSLQDQQRIVEILDRFDTLCNDLSAGLPAEIEARQKQYEYYRDKLLSFKELPK